TLPATAGPAAPPMAAATAAGQAFDVPHQSRPSAAPRTAPVGPNQISERGVGVRARPTTVRKPRASSISGSVEAQYATGDDQQHFVGGAGDGGVGGAEDVTEPAADFGRGGHAQAHLAGDRHRVAPPPPE